MKNICFLSMDDLGSYVADDDLAIEPLRARGIAVETLSWRQTSRPWDDFDAAIIRTTWDYQHDKDKFLGVLETIGSATRLYNPADVARKNCDKVYLRELEEQGVAAVPTLWDEAYTPEAFSEWQAKLGSEHLIIKPRVSATAQNTFRLKGFDASIAETFHERPFMVQPFIPAIVEKGEYSLFYFNGVLSHTILKSPKSDDFRVQEEHGGSIRPAEATPELSAAAEQALAAIGETLLYARVDLVEHEGHFLLMELELIEPALYFRMDDGAAERFAAAVEYRLSEDL